MPFERDTLNKKVLEKKVKTTGERCIVRRSRELTSREPTNRENPAGRQHISIIAFYFANHSRSLSYTRLTFINITIAPSYVRAYLLYSNSIYFLYLLYKRLYVSIYDEQASYTESKRSARASLCISNVPFPSIFGRRASILVFSASSSHPCHSDASTIVRCCDCANARLQPFPIDVRTCRRVRNTVRYAIPRRFVPF